MTAPHLTLVRSPTPGAWLASSFSTPGLPFDGLIDAIEMFVDLNGGEPDILYVHPTTQFWLSFMWSNFDLEGNPEPEPFWVDLSRVPSHGVPVVVTQLVPPGWWFFVVSIDAEKDLLPWT